jgi:hypothetical protein
MKQGCSDNEGCGGDPPDERQLPKKYLTSQGKGGAPELPRFSTPPPHSADNAWFVNFLNSLTNPDILVSVFSFLDMRWLMMMLCTCKFFSSSYASDYILEIAQKSLFLTFPKLSFIHPDMKFVDLRRMYVDYFMYASGESLFSDDGRCVLTKWLRSEPRNPPEGTFTFSNLPWNLNVLRKAGFFSTLYLRWRLYRTVFSLFLTTKIELMQFPVPSELPYSRRRILCIALRRLMNCEFICRLCLDSYCPSSCPTYPSYWNIFPMHFPFLGPSNTPYHMDIFELDVQSLNNTFTAFSQDPTMKGLRLVFPGLIFQDEIDRILEYMRFASTLPNDVSIGPNVFFPYNAGVFHPLAWGNWVPPLLRNVDRYRIINVVTEPSTDGGDLFWTEVVDMCRRSRVYGDDRELISLLSRRQIANALEVAEPPS